jgi:hypothetical protein
MPTIPILVRDARHARDSDILQANYYNFMSSDFFEVSVYSGHNSCGGRKHMRFDRWQCVRVAVACSLAFLFAVPQSLFAQSHVVDPADLQKQVVSASQSRQHNLEVVRGFLSSDRAKTALKSAHMDPEQVNTAVSSLSDQELAQLAARSQKAQTDFAAGNLSDRDLIIILIAVAVLILIIVAVR